MTVRYLLDTNVVSEPLRPIPNRGVVRKLEKHQEECGIASLVWHELFFGCARLEPSRKKAAIERYLFEAVRAALPIFDYDQAAAEWHASERARLGGAGRTPPFLDGQIAAVAKVNGLILVTANLSHFEPFGGLETEDWRD